MIDWTYEIRDNETHQLLLDSKGFDTESDAELQAHMEIKARNIKNCYVRTFQTRQITEK